jgi:hypothetical protein
MVFPFLNEVILQHLSATNARPYEVVIEQAKPGQCCLLSATRRVGLKARNQTSPPGWAGMLKMEIRFIQ